MFALKQQVQSIAASADGVATDVLQHVSSKTFQVRNQLESRFNEGFAAVLKKTAWPSSELDLSDALLDEFSRATIRLLRLQQPELEAEEEGRNSSSPPRPSVLLPFQALGRPLEVAFRFHFEISGAGQADNPERFLSYTLDKTIGRHMNVVQEYLQPLLNQQFKGTVLALNFAYIDAATAFISSVLPMVRNKLLSILPVVSEQPTALSKLMHQLQDFDAQLKEQWEYTGGSSTENWPGLTGELLATDSLFAHWLSTERDCKSLQHRFCL